MDENTDCHISRFLDKLNFMSSGVQSERVKSKNFPNNLKYLGNSARLVLITNRKSHMGFPLVPNLVTLNDLERRNDLYFTDFGSFGGQLRKGAEALD